MLCPFVGTSSLNLVWADLGAFGRIWALFGRSRVAKSKLERAVEERASDLNDAQKELVMSQLSAYRKNLARLSKVESEIAAVNAVQAATREDVRLKQARRASLTYEHGQLTTANSRIAADLNEFLKE